MKFILICIIFVHSTLLAENFKSQCTTHLNKISKIIISKPTDIPHLLGYANQIKGQVEVVAADKSRHKIKTGEPIFEGESVVTDSAGGMQLKMTDGGLLTISPNTNVQFIKYQDDCLSECTFVSKILVGSMRYVTGLVGKINPKYIQLKTPTVVLGHRGTDHKITVLLKSHLNVQAGTYDRVYSGGTTISNIYGRVDVDAGQVGFGALSGDLAPRILKNEPDFLNE